MNTPYFSSPFTDTDADEVTGFGSFSPRRTAMPRAPRRSSVQRIAATALVVSALALGVGSHRAAASEAPYGKPDLLEVVAVPGSSTDAELTFNDSATGET